MFVKLFLSVIMVYVVLSNLYYLLRKKSTPVTLINTRKIYYTLYIIGIMVGIWRGSIDYLNWTLLTELIAVAIVIDLTIYQTPNILKFANTEFQQNEVISKTIKENVNAFQLIGKRSKLILEIIEKTEAYFINKRGIQTFKQYKREVLNYLKEYTEVLNLDVQIHQFTNNTDETIAKEDIKHKLSKVTVMVNVSLSNKSEAKIINELFQCKTQMLEENSSYVMPFYGKKYNLLIAIKGKDILPTDATNIIAMFNFFEWYLL